MKIDFGFQKNYKKILGKYMEWFGFTFFVFTFWMPGGFFLGGDPTFLGPFFSSLEIVFPWCGIGIFFLFFGRFLNQSSLQLSQSQILYILLFLGLFSISSIFSLHPQTSILFLLIWTVTFLTITAGETFFIQGIYKRSIWILSVVLGYCSLFLFPEIEISKEIIGMGAVLGMVFLFHEMHFWGRIFFLVIYLWIIFEIGIFGLLLLSFFVFLSVKIWTSIFRNNIKKYEIWGTVMISFFLMIWGIVSQKFDTTFVWGWIDGWMSGWNILFGVGEGQYLIALQQLSETYLVPQKLILPSNSYIFFLIEKGILGFLFLLSFLIFPIYFNEKKHFIFPVLFFVFFFFTTDLIATENGILFLGAMIFAHSSLRRFSHRL